MPETGGRRPDSTRLSPAAAVFVASALGLFVEMALIRWVSSEIRVFAYLKNLVLVATFLGFGAGCLRHRRRADMATASFVLLVIALLVRLPWASLWYYGPKQVSVALAQISSGLTMFRSWQMEGSGAVLPLAAFALGWTTALFCAIAFVMVPYGQLTARNLAELRSPLRGYSASVAGSLAGILAYVGATWAALPPVCWFVPAVLAAVLFERRPRGRQALLAIAGALLLVLAPDDTPEHTEYWSRYQKLLFTGNAVQVNNINYQFMRQMPDLSPGQEVPLDRLTLQYAVRRPPGRVLIVGAGTGNDASAALRAGATSVIAVEIDPLIFKIGYEHHPDRPYLDPRVRVVIDDARHFLRAVPGTYDVIVFSHLDSHTLLSSFTNVRLDNYIYTVEAFGEARAHLAPGGMLYVTFLQEAPFIGARLYRNLTEAFGHPPLGLEGVQAQEIRHEWRNVFFLTGEAGVMPGIEAAAAGWPPTVFRRLDYTNDSTPPSTDAWPFLMLERHRMPAVMLLMSLAIAVVAAVFVGRMRTSGEPFDGRVFWLGAAFLLLETHNVSRLALVFGTTWEVNAWVVSAILGVILVANVTVERLRDRGPGAGPPAWAVAGLFLALGAAWAAPVGSMDRWLVTALLTLPIYFAGIVFADAFARSASAPFALGWNVLGSVVGGLAENLSYVFGIPAMVLLAALFYAVALWWPARHREAGLAASRA